VGGRMGGGAGGRAAGAARPGEIDRLVLLAPSGWPDPEAIVAGSSLFVVSRGDRGLGRTRSLFARAPEPSRLEILDGDAHAQHIFATRQAEELTRLIIRFLEESP